MLKFINLISLIVCLSCGSTIECSKEARSGMYMLTIEEVSGTCGPIEGGLTVVGGSANDNTGYDYSSWSEDECDFNSSFTIDFPGDNITANYISTTSQEDSEGDFLTGTLTLEVRQLSTGAFLCSGTYNLEATRQ